VRALGGRAGRSRGNRDGGDDREQQELDGNGFHDSAFLASLLVRHRNEEQLTCQLRIRSGQRQPSVPDDQKAARSMQETQREVQIPHGQLDRRSRLGGPFGAP